jgi:hypothetical protein
MRYRDTRPAALGDAKVQVLVGGEPIAITPTRANVSDPDNARVYDVTFAVPRPGHVDIRSNTFVPARESAPSDDIRQLGIDIVSLTAATAPQGTEQPVRMAEFPPMPVSDAQPWSFELSTWFWGASTHLADVWPWYLWLSGLPRWLVLLALVPAGALVWSAWRLRLALRMCS